MLYWLDLYLQRDISSIYYDYKIIDKDGTYTIPINNPFLMRDVLISGYQEDPALITIYVDDYPAITTYINKGLSGAVLSGIKGSSSIKIEAQNVSNPIYTTITYEVINMDRFNYYKELLEKLLNQQNSKY